MNEKLISLREIEGSVSPHQAQLDRALQDRKEALEHVADVSGLADFIGGTVASPGVGEDWAISKEIFPGVQVYFIYNRADEEFPGSLRVLYSGDRLGLLSGGDLIAMTITCSNHILRYIRDTHQGKDLPEVCYRV